MNLKYKLIDFECVNNWPYFDIIYNRQYASVENSPNHFPFFSLYTMYLLLHCGMYSLPNSCH